jgi:hypothetical protein
MENLFFNRHRRWPSQALLRVLVEPYHPSMSDVSQDQALQLMAQPKLCGAALVWSERDNHVGLMLTSAQPEDATGAILPGLTLQLEI